MCSSNQRFLKTACMKPRLQFTSGSPRAYSEVVQIYQMVFEELLGKKQPAKELLFPRLFKDRRNSSLSSVISEVRVPAAVKALSDTLVQNVGKSPRNFLAFKHCSSFLFVFQRGMHPGRHLPAGSSHLYKDTP